MVSYVFWIGLGCFTACWLTNAVIMIISPAYWYNLPRWMIGVQKPDTRKKYSCDSGAIQMRILGVIFVLIPIYIFCDIMWRK